MEGLSLSPQETHPDLHNNHNNHHTVDDYDTYLHNDDHESDYGNSDLDLHPYDNHDPNTDLLNERGRDRHRSHSGSRSDGSSSDHSASAHRNDDDDDVCSLRSDK